VEIDIDYDESRYAFGDYRANPYKAFVNISIGCDKQCTFCIVPHTRGDEISIPADLIIQEAKKAAEKGAKEIFLLGQNVNNYGRRFSGEHPKTTFTDLLKMVSEIEAVERIRFTSPHPLHMDDAFLHEFATNPKICKSMHMPLQSGSTRILKAMKRGYSKEWFLDRAAKLRAMVPNVSISTDIIVAFPGETDADFEETMEVLETVRFEQVFSFRYSPRPLTPAQNYPDQVPDAVASQRLSRLQNRHNEILDELKQERLGRIYDVYFEELRAGNTVAGRTDNNLLITVPGSEELLGRTLPVRVTEAGRVSCKGEVIA
jgi:tRNA-2-methylthio-N6-dimethylallyladenosine synthase